MVVGSAGEDRLQSDVMAVGEDRPGPTEEWAVAFERAETI